MTAPPGMQQCDDFMQFQSALKEMRQIDDKIVYAINQSIPTASFKGQSDAKENCKGLHETIKVTYDARAAAVTKCILYTQDQVENMRASGDKANLRSAQLSLRLYKNELSIEEVIRGRTQGIFHEKCRDYYTISNSNS